MDPQFIVLPPRRRSAVSAAVSAALHVVSFVGAIAAVQAGMLERPQPPEQSLRFVMMLSQEVPPPVVAALLVDAGSPAVASARPADEPVVPKVPATPEPQAPHPETLDAPVPTPPSAESPTLVPVEVNGATGRTGPIVGAFDRPSAPRASAPRPVEATVSAGFGAGRAAVLPDQQAQVVRTGGFELERAPVARAVVVPAEPVDTPVEIVFKPTPGYTDEAIALRVQGDVVLEAEFAISGDIRVVRIVSGLGHGLDEVAVRAAERIRFKPATRGGSPVQVRAIVHIVFRLP